MEIVKKKWKKNMVVKAWERCCKTRSSSIPPQKKRKKGSSSVFGLAIKFKVFEMEIVKKKWKKNMVVKAWERCCKTRSSSISSNTTHVGVAKAAPEGCFPVYVGPQRQRFVIKTEFANHPLFRMLLQGAELEYGFSNEGPLLLPCDVDMFNQVLAEIHSGDQQILTPLCTPSPRRSSFNKGYYGSYQLLTPS